MENGKFPMNDHDLLVSISTTLGRAVQDIAEVSKQVTSLKDGVVKDVATLEKEKFDKKDAEKLQQDVEGLKDELAKYKWLIIGGAAVVSALISVASRFF